MSERARFEAARGFALDDYQARALDAIDAGRSVLVAAPTGSGKTVVAEYAISRALAKGAKTFYTTPLKALSNQKYHDLVREHGESRVGLLTGDNAVNGAAPVVVMTTEVLRNMIYAASPTLDGLRYVVLDEVHYLQDRYRGSVWEEVIVHLPPEVDLVCLSATVSNAEELAAWIETVRGETSAIIEERRPVALEHRYVLAERGSDHILVFPTFVEVEGAPRPNPEVLRLERRAGRGPRPTSRRGPAVPSRSGLRLPDRVEVVEMLSADDLLPAIVFVFSRAGCEQSVQRCRRAGIQLTTPEERAQIAAIADAHLGALSDDDLDVLGATEWLDALGAGLAAHHAGMVPPMKEAVEAAFALGLVKVVFATETLALGINMPARSVVIEKPSKFSGERHEFLTAGEYTQLTGRAGRRGIDTAGYALVCWSPYVSFEQVAGLASRRTDALRSSFRPTYNMTVNLVQRYPRETAHHLLDLSFAQFHADRDVVALERRLARQRDLLARERERARSPFGDVDDYRRLLAGAAAETSGRRRRRSDAMASVRPGDVIWIGSRGGPVVVLGQEHRRAPRVLALTRQRGVVRLGAADFERPPVVVGHVRLPEPYAPRSPAFRREVEARLRRARLDDPDTRVPEDGAASRPAGLEAHPVRADPELDARVRAAIAVERLEAEIARLERRARGRDERLARQFERVRGLLESWGYLSQWSLTPAGTMLARLYAETDLLLAESLREGHLDGLSPPETVAVVSCFSYERRTSDGGLPQPPLHWPTRAVADRARHVERRWRDLAAAEEDARLVVTRPPDPGFSAYAYAWADAQSLGAVLEDGELTGGDFVRNMKQCIDLLGQVADVAPVPDTREAARRGAALARRGVVAATGAVPSS